MNKTVTIISLTGSQPYNVSICDSNYNNCFYISTITNVDLPYTFLIPSIYLSLTEVSVKVIDANHCEIKNKVNT